MDYKTKLTTFCETQLNKKAPSVPTDIANLLNEPNSIKTISVTDCNDILLDKALQQQVGYSILPNGGWYVAMKSPMPNVTKEMIDWWFWWVPQAPIRYQMWFPGSHKTISYDAKDERYFKEPFSKFRPNTQFPDEIIGSIKGKLTIEFVYATDFGFSQKAISESKVETIVCGHFGLVSPKIQHTEMCHLFFKSENGLEIVSRFWLGNKISMQPTFFNKIIDSRFVKSKIFDAKRAKDMTEHCCMEYRNLATFLPKLYNEFA